MRMPLPEICPGDGHPFKRIPGLPGPDGRAAAHAVAPAQFNLALAFGAAHGGLALAAVRAEIDLSPDGKGTAAEEAHRPRVPLAVNSIGFGIRWGVAELGSRGANLVERQRFA